MLVPGSVALILSPVTSVNPFFRVNGFSGAFSVSLMLVNRSNEHAFRGSARENLCYTYNGGQKSLRGI